MYYQNLYWDKYDYSFFTPFLIIIKIKVSNPAVKGLNKEYIVHVNRGASPPKVKKEKTKKAKKQKSNHKKSDSKDDWFDSLDSCEDNNENETSDENFEDSSEENESETEENSQNEETTGDKTEEIKENIPENNDLKMLIIKISCALVDSLIILAYFIIKKRKNPKK